MHCRYFLTLLGLVYLGATLPVQAQPPAGPERVLSPSHAMFNELLLSGGPGKDGIPAIGSPKFSDAGDADDYLKAQDIVFGVYHQGEAKAYPQRIMVWHEIVNDSLGGEPVSITYCPLTATAIGFKRGSTSLGVSGKLLNSNVVMYDRASDSYWSQIAAVAIEGPLKGQSLDEIQVTWTTWARWKERYPQTQVLTERTGYMRNYNRDPYGSYSPLHGYYIEPQVMFPVTHSRPELHAKQMIRGFRTSQVAVAINREYLEQQGVVHYQHADRHYLIIQDSRLDTAWVYESDARIALDPATLSFTQDGPQAPELLGLAKVNMIDAMWFAWATFYPQTVLLDAPDSL
ncbi:TPA: DUF3179 domain-containing protein [Pseudomonas aeruginosa]|uniref:DUF3179 domain-containing protein n=1 Tax=Pseudomonas sp. TaxID=306 RepID=UPI000696E627|nr:DUF3179 domain-containing protein [Pseudomonas aeruginosa]